MSLDSLRSGKDIRTAQSPLDDNHVVLLLQEISDKLSILIKYEAMLHKIDLEDDI